MTVLRLDVVWNQAANSDSGKTWAPEYCRCIGTGKPLDSIETVEHITGNDTWPSRKRIRCSGSSTAKRGKGGSDGTNVANTQHRTSNAQGTATVLNVHSVPFDVEC